MASGAGSVTTRSLLTMDPEALAMETAAARGELEAKGISTEAFSDLDVRIYSMCVSCFGLSAAFGADTTLKRGMAAQMQNPSMLQKIMQIFKDAFPSEESTNLHFAYLRHPLVKPFYNASKIKPFTERLLALMHEEILAAVLAEINKEKDI